MKKKTTVQVLDFAAKEQRLKEVQQDLKKEFIGIDGIIDQLMENISSWYYYPEYQEKPLVINLWGMTGVGKTALIHSLVQKLQCEHSYFHMDLANTSGPGSWEESLKSLFRYGHTIPPLVVLDEIHTLCDYEDDKRRAISNEIWEFIDEGKLSSSEQWLEDDDRNQLYQLLSLLELGVEVEKGMVKARKDLYLEEMEEVLDSEITSKNKIPFIPEAYFKGLMPSVRKLWGITIKSGLKEYLKGLDTLGIHEFIYKLLGSDLKLKNKTYKNALIFVIGNLDGAYAMSESLSSEINPDIYYEESLKIGVPEIKKELGNLFKNEHVARLGNIHLIYPAINKLGYEHIIFHLCQQYLLRFTDQIDFDIVLEHGVYDLIYKEGVYPSQGVRAVQSTINQHLKANVSQVIAYVRINKLALDKCVIDYDEEVLKASLLKGGEVVDTWSKKIHLSLESKRQPKKDDKQAIAAVHESGHAVLMMRLLQVLPDEVRSVSADPDVSGYAIMQNKGAVFYKKDMVNRVAVYLGGMIAEQLVFGEEYLTEGCESDLIKATNFLRHMLGEQGMGDLPVKYSTGSLLTSRGHEGRKVIKKRTEVIIKEAMVLAKATLQEEISLLLHMANYLSDYPILKAINLKQMALQRGVKEMTFIQNFNHFYYRNKLKEVKFQLDQELNIPEGMRLLKRRP